MRIVANALKRSNDKELEVPRIENMSVLKIHKDRSNGEIMYHIKMDLLIEDFDGMGEDGIILDFIYMVLHDYEGGYVSINRKLIEQESTLEEIIQSAKKLN